MVNTPVPDQNSKNEGLIANKSMSVHRSLVARRGLNPGASAEKRDFTRYPQTIKASKFLKEVLPANKLLERDLRRQLIQG